MGEVTVGIFLKHISLENQNDEYLFSPFISKKWGLSAGSEPQAKMLQK